MPAGSLPLDGDGGDCSAFWPSLDDARTRASGRPRIAVVTVRDGDGLQHVDDTDSQPRAV